MATIDVNIIAISSNFNSKSNNFLFNFLDKSSEGKAVTLHTLYGNALRISRNFNLLDKSLEDRQATLHTFGNSVLQISRARGLKRI